MRYTFIKSRKKNVIKFLWENILILNVHCTIFIYISIVKENNLMNRKYLSMYELFSELESISYRKGVKVDNCFKFKT